MFTLRCEFNVFIVIEIFTNCLRISRAFWGKLLTSENLNVTVFTILSLPSPTFLLLLSNLFMGDSVREKLIMQIRSALRAQKFLKKYWGIFIEIKYPWDRASSLLLPWDHREIQILGNFDVSASNKKELLVQSFFNDQNDWQNVMRKKKLSDIARTDEHFTEKKDQFTEKKVNLHTDSNRKRV